MSRFADMLSDLGFATYNDYLDGDHWRQFRKRYMASGRSRKCAACESTAIQLHHINYSNLGEEELSDVMPLCREHHIAVHAWLKENKKPVGCSLKALAFIGKRKTKRHAKPKKQPPTVSPASHVKSGNRYARTMLAEARALLDLVPNEMDSKRLHDLSENGTTEKIRKLIKSIRGRIKGLPLIARPACFLTKKQRRQKKNKTGKFAEIKRCKLCNMNVPKNGLLYCTPCKEKNNITELPPKRELPHNPRTLRPGAVFRKRREQSCPTHPKGLST
jgi:hypothetical protein